ncbi:DUF803-domain-containing protein [Peniophora sp. CONT]|nr:DUF803-domain-containing protein [Peniophora sp. CONT]
MPSLPSLAVDPGDINWPQFDSATAAGIAVAVIGNVLISLALNLQKLAHRRLELQRSPSPQSPVEDDESLHTPTPLDITADPNPWSRSSQSLHNLHTPGVGTPLHGETQPLLRVVEGSEHSYGAGGSAHEMRTHKKGGSWTVFLRWRERSEPQMDAAREQEDGDANEKGDSYLKSKLWWAGFTLMNVGEIGNFISYGFAPASVVAPLGTFALVANCFFSPLILHEHFRKRDLFGVAVAIIGAVTVVLSANASDARLTPDQILEAISQTIFEVFACVYIIGAFILVNLSSRAAGDKYVLVDVGCCALFGGFTVLSTKGVSTLLTTRGLRMFESWITYPIIVVLVATGVGQVRYLNRALMRFDSKIVIPAQFVLFNLSAIVGSAILYGDFRHTTFHQFVTFLYGCSATFAGVFIIASGSEQSASKKDGGREDNAEPVADVYVGEPGSAPRKINVIRPRESVVSLVGLSPAQVRFLRRSASCAAQSEFELTCRTLPFLFVFDQGLLLVHTPQLEEPPALLRGRSGAEHPSLRRGSSLARRRGVPIEWVSGGSGTGEEGAGGARGSL